MAEECTHECSSCGESGCSDRTAQGPSTIETNSRSNIKHVIGVVSGKGGVGKSLVTSLLASEMQKRGKNVGILPGQTQSGIKVMSTNLMLPKDDIPVAWRGPVVSNAIRQFYSETNWGEIDYLFVDMPPGTSDVFLTVFQSLPVDGIVTVSAPQELVAMIVGKAVNLAHDMNVELLGLVENMAYFECPDCGKRHHIFGDPQGAAVAERYDIPAYATLPIDPSFARLCDAGKVEDYDVAGALDPIIAQIEAAKQD